MNWMVSVGPLVGERVQEDPLWVVLKGFCWPSWATGVSAGLGFWGGSGFLAGSGWSGPVSIWFGGGLGFWQVCGLVWAGSCLIWSGFRSAPDRPRPDSSLFAHVRYTEHREIKKTRGSNQTLVTYDLYYTLHDVSTTYDVRPQCLLETVNRAETGQRPGTKKGVLWGLSGASGESVSGATSNLR